MAIAYEMPRWIGQPADPAAHYQAGFQIGVHLGAQQAAQMFQQQQMAMQRQKDLMAAQQQEVENQYQMQVLNLKAAEMGRKHAANQEFRARVSAGEDPSQVLMQLAPELGESAASVLHTQAIREQAGATQDFRERNMQRLDEAAQERLQAAKDAREQALTEKKSEFQQREARMKSTAQSRIRQAAENAISRDKNLSGLRSTAEDLKSTIDSLGTDKWSLAHPTRTASVIASEKTAAEKSLKETLADIAKREQEIRNHFQAMSSEVNPDDASFNPETWAVPEPSEGLPSVGLTSAGDNTMPDRPTAPARRLRFTGSGFEEVK